MGQPAHVRFNAPRPEWGTGTLFAKAVDDTRRTVTALLTYPQIDLDGDLVEPTGGEWTAAPYVNIEHDPTCVVGTGTVEMKSVMVDGETLTLPFGRTTFGDTYIGRQAFELVKAGVYPGVSVEFRPLQSTPIGKSLLQARPAYHFHRWKGEGWAFCAEPKNRYTHVVPDSIGKALSLIETNRIGSEKLHPLICKALSRAVAPWRGAKPTTVRGGFGGNKAMPDDLNGNGAASGYEPGMDPPPTDAPAADPDAPDVTPEESVSHDTAQVCLDLAERLKSVRTLHGPSGKLFPKMAEMLETVAEKLSGHGESISSQLNGGGESGDDPETEEVEDPETGEKKSVPRPPPPLVVGSDGVILTKSGYVPKLRLSMADLKPINDAADAQKAAQIERENRRMEAEIVRLERRLQYAQNARRT